MKAAIVILNWNTEGFLKKFLPGVIRSTADMDGCGVIVADNASSDGSLELLREMFPEIPVISFGKNYGFTGGYNKALGEVEAEYFILMNSDIEVPDGWLRPLIEWMDTHPECGACSPKLHSWQERDMFEYAGAAGGYLDRYGYPFCRGRVMKRVEKDEGQYDMADNVLWASGACLVVRSSLYRHLGGLDDRFFAHMEEIDLCWRMQLEGWKVSIVPESVVYHVGGGTLPASSPFKLFLNFRNNLLMLDNNLAYTMALEGYERGMDIEKAAKKAVRKAGRRICTRMVLDILSASAYLLTLKIGCFKAVMKAHREFCKLRKGTDVKMTVGYLREHGDRGNVTGMYRKWIIAESFLRGKDIFKSIRKENFYR